MTVLAVSAHTYWVIALVIGLAAALVVAALLAIRISGQAKTAALAVNQLRDQTADLNGVARINDSGVRILHAARALRKVAVGK